MLVELRAITNDQRIRESAVMISSTMLDKILLLGIAAHVLERQHRDRRLIGQGRVGVGLTDEAVVAVSAVATRTR